VNQPAPTFDFELADRAYQLFTLDEKRKALGIMAKLQYPCVTDRFFEAVSLVIYDAVPAPGETKGAQE
jgi:hypothetical protein